MQIKFNRLLLASSIALAFSGQALAQSTTPDAVSYELGKVETNSLVNSATGTLLTTIPQGAGGYKTESGITLYPSVSVGVGFNDNVSLTSANKVGSNFVNISPSLLAALNYKGDRYTAQASVNSVMYPSNSVENTVASTFKLAGDKYFSTRARGGWSAGLTSGAAPRDANSPTAEPDRWRNTSLNGTFAYGADGAKGRLEADIGTNVKTYDNNRAKTAALDLTVNNVAGRVFARVGSRTLALAEISQAQTKYASALSTDNSTDRKYYVGVTWEATAATTGMVKVGSMTKDFDNGKVGSYSGASWDASVTWKPRTYSAFQLSTSKKTSETTDATAYSYALDTATNLSWAHAWTSAVSTNASVAVVNSSYPGSTKAPISTNSYSLGANYAFRRWLTVGVDFTASNANSANALSEYKKNVTMFTLNASL